MKITIEVDGKKMSFEVSEEELSVMVEADYQERLKKAEDKATVQRKSPQTILNALYKREDDSKKRLHSHWVRPKFLDGKDDRPACEYDAFAAVKRNPAAGYNYSKFEKLTSRSPEEVIVGAMTERQIMQLLRENLTPDQFDLVMAVIINGRKKKDYAEEKGVSKAAITLRMNTVRKKLRKILNCP